MCRHLEQCCELDPASQAVCLVKQEVAKGSAPILALSPIDLSDIERGQLGTGSVFGKQHFWSDPPAPDSSEGEGPLAQPLADPQLCSELCGWYRSPGVAEACEEAVKERKRAIRRAPPKKRRKTAEDQPAGKGGKARGGTGGKRAAAGAAAAQGGGAAAKFDPEINTMTRTLALALTLAALLLAGAASAAPTCPLSAEAVAKADFSGVKAACPVGAPQAKLCSDCICALVQTVTPVLKASGLSIDGLTREQATSYISACIGLVLPPLQRAGVSLSALMQLTSCPATPVPPCLAGIAAP
ncbi:hypothetical protein ABPG75_010165 [Micractinium tetrahymenae]